MPNEQRQASSEQSSDDHARQAIRRVVILGALIWSCLAWVTLESEPFRADRQSNDNLPIRLVVVLYMTASFISLAAFFVARRLKRQQAGLTMIIVAFGLAFRLTQLFSTPVLEIDHYRYMWDGIVTSHGMSPYRYSPKQILEAAKSGDEAYLNEVAGLGHNSASRTKILKTVHFPEYTTLYPPVSQLVFAATMFVVPASASVAIHLFAMKLALLSFDIGVVLILVALVRHFKFHPAVVLGYAWNPLVIKEIANSAHLDSIAVFFCMAAVYFAARLAAAPSRATRSAVASAVCLGLGVGAKIYPVILLPLLAWAIFRWCDSKKALVFLIAFALTCAVSIGPMFVEIQRSKDSQTTYDRTVSTASSDQSNEGLTAFLSKWRMNDVVFSVIHENLNPTIRSEDPSRPWYVWTSDGFRKSVHEKTKPFVRQSTTQYFLARITTLILFGMGYFLILGKVSKVKKSGGQRSAETLLQMAFLVLAWFFILQPTQNPWYWLWAIPFVGFAKNSAWLFVSPLLFVYYLRFWFRGLSGQFHFIGFEYSGVSFFDHCVVWLEYLPIVILWLAVTILGRAKSTEPE